MALSSFDEVFAINEDLATNGVWVRYGKMRVRIGYQGDSNINFVKAVQKHTKDRRHELANETIAEDDAREMWQNILAEGIVYDWEATDESGKPIPYSVAECLKQFRRPKTGKLFFQEVQAMSKKLANFRDDTLKVDEGN
jgi:hypothetical protein